MNSANQNENRHSILRIVGIYALFGGLWLFLSHVALQWFVHDTAILARIDEIDDFVFILLTAPLLYLLLCRYTRRLEASEQSSRESEAKFRSFFDLSLDAVFLTIPDGTVVDANRAACKTFGMTVEEICRVGRTGIMDTSDPRLAPALEERMRTGWIKTELTCIRKNGELFQAEVSSVFVQGDLPRSFVIIRDITERKQAEDDLRRYSRRLIELEEELRKDLATELHDEIGRDLAVLGMNLAIISNRLPEAASQNLSGRVQEAGRLVEGISCIIRSIMASLHPPVLDDFGLLAALRWHAELFSKRTGIEVSVQADEPFPRLALEKETSLFRISQEALINAAKHAETRIVTIKLWNSDGMIRFEVADEGNGFNPASLVHIQEGSGWGMKIMRERAELLGGEYRVESAPGKGTVVSVNLPLEEM